MRAELTAGAWPAACGEDLDAAWKQPGAIQADMFVALVYSSL